jgi:hypothetical protein
MSKTLYDSRNPHPDCRIYGVPSEKVNGLSMTQAAARRRIDHIGVLKVHMQGGPVGLGMKSTVSSCPRMLVATPWHHGPKTPGVRTPRSPKPPKQNPCFYKKFAKGRAIEFEYAKRWLDKLTRVHLAIAQGRGGVRLEQSYEDQRLAFLAKFPRDHYKVEAMELDHNRRVK